VRNVTSLGFSNLQSAFLLVLLTLLPLLPGSTHAEPGPSACVLVGEKPRINLAPCAEWLAEGDVSQTYTQIADPSGDSGFVPVGERFVGYGYGAAPYWFRILLTRAPDAPELWYLVLGETFLDEIRVFIEDGDGQVTATVVGDRVPFDARPMQTPRHVVPIRFSASETVTIHVRVATRGALSFHASAWQAETFLEDAVWSGLLQGGFFGVLGFVILVHLLFGVVLRDPATLAYSVYVLGQFSNYAGVSGAWPVVIGYAPPALMDNLSKLGGLLAVVGVLAMGYFLFSLRRTGPWLGRLYGLIIALTLGMMLLVHTPVFERLAPILYFGGIAGAMANLGMAAVLFHRGQRKFENLLFILAFGVAAVAALPVVLALMGVVPSYVRVMLDNYQISILINVLVMSVALAGHMRGIAQDRRTALEEAALASERERDQRRLIAMLSHELRSPLAGIKTAGETLLRTGANLSEGGRRRAEHVVEGAGRLLSLVTRFLDAEVVATGRLQPVRRQTSVTAFLEQVRDDAGDGGRLELRPPVPDLHAAFDPELLGLAVGNLVANALCYAPPETPVTLIAGKGEGGGITLTVKDEGPGMSPVELAELGRRYYRGAAAAGTKGTGLGVFVASRIAAAHGGRLVFESTRGHGTQARIILPLE